MTEEFAKHFAEEWVSSWNSHNLERILEHYTEDFTIETPMALKIKPETEGVVVGKNQVREYWQQGLKLIPNLRFEIIDVLTGINGLTIYYRNTATGRKTVEIMFFNEQQKVEKAFAMYS
ncbi:nuclear transport factor 2 family protein [Adhaeribacter radiodurans]|uniref:Nuclear transport factor 2 family protein n=1 Tax=Adhaeribacter radiodurans TaxID=2745197 RepID=A0A7L7LBA7_9BACT|nr:nuclear transport factor 2 family protein [Adhaeribacter radiodurans]QMU30017.1 nuclear transport factor 2 family protein [Adhaeribacter radiodurans]